MQCKKASLIINPRAGENLAKISDVLAVLSAAGWKTTLALKEYGGQTMELATKADRQDEDVIIAYGGDGTLNQVVNGVMNTKGKHGIVALIPGGTANVWASEVNVPADPVKAALTLVNSEPRKVDIGHVEVEGFTHSDINPSQDNLEQEHVEDGKQFRQRKGKGSAQARHHFLLMAGLGIDAAVMGHVSKPLKYKIGALAVGVSAAKELPSQHPFPVEIRAGSPGRSGEVLWKGEAIQVVIGNSRRYANIVEMTPNAYIDDGVLDVCVITAGDPLSMMQQLASLLLRRKPDNVSAEYFHGAHLSISVPASVGLQLDGSAVKLEDYLSKADDAALEHTGDAEHVMVHYRFDAMPRALQVAVPRTYDDALFEESGSAAEGQPSVEQQSKEEEAQANKQGKEEDTSAQHHEKDAEEGQMAVPAVVQTLMEKGRKVTVVAVGPNPERKATYIIAGNSPKKSTGEARPVAVCIDSNTTVMKHDGEHVAPDSVQQLKEGMEIVVEGKKSKRGVIHATRAVI